MARLGRIAATESGRYRDLDTGHFISAVEAEPLITASRLYGELGALDNSRFSRAIDTITFTRGLDAEEARRRIEGWLREKAEATLQGQEGPDFSAVYTD